MNAFILTDPQIPKYRYIQEDFTSCGNETAHGNATTDLHLFIDQTFKQEIEKYGLVETRVSLHF